MIRTNPKNVVRTAVVSPPRNGVVSTTAPWTHAVTFVRPTKKLGASTMYAISDPRARRPSESIAPPPTKFSLIPGIFMIVTTLAALAWQTATFLYSVYAYLNNDASWINRNVRPPIQNNKDYVLVAVGINAVFVAVGAVLFAVGLSMAVRLFRSYRISFAESLARAQVGSDGGKGE